LGSSETSIGGTRGDFPETGPELLARLIDPSGRLSDAMIEELCRRYWKPVYRYIRVVFSKQNEDAKDLTQAFFAWIVEGGAVGKYDREQGSLRTFLKTILRNFVINREHAIQALKRGGAARRLSLDGVEAMEIEAPAGADPEDALDRAWAMEVARAAIARVRAQFLADGRERLIRSFEASDLHPAGERPSYAQVAKKLGIKEDDVRNDLRTVRRAVRDEIRRELSRTTASLRDLEDEWNALFGHG
jgi:RNA polymerase sigma-70 factor (ECF subfamily)